MKHSGFHRAIVALTMMLIGWLPSLAHDFEVDGVFYKKTSDNTVAVTYKVDSYNSYSNEYIGDVVIPSSVKYNGVTYSVTSIGNYAFSLCSSLTSIQIPNSVTSIGDSAFGGCSSLFKITCLATNPPTIESDTFNSYSAELFVPACCISAYQSANYWKHFNIKELPIILSTFIALNKTSYISFTMDQVTLKTTGVTDDYGNPQIDGFTYDIIDAVTSIESGLSVPSYNNSNADLRVYANGTMTLSTTDGTNFENIVFTIPSSGNGQKRLAPITASEGAVTLDNSAWTVTWTGSASEVTFTVGAKSDWGTESGKAGRFVVSTMEVTTGGASLKAHDFEVDGVYYDKINSSEVEVTYKGNYWYSYSNEYIGDVVIPSSVKYNGVTYSVTSIGDEAFRSCSSLTSIQIPNSVTSIGESAFQSCESLTSIEIPNSVTSIGDSAFEGCSSLTSIEIPNSVTSIGDYAFYYCESLTSVIWNSVRCSDFDFAYTPFSGCPNITSFTFGDEVEHIPARLCDNLSSLISIEIPNSVTSIGDGAFRGCSSLTSIQIPNSVTSIGNNAFYYCLSLTSIVIPNSVTSIGDGAFADCTSLTSIQIPNSVTSIGEYAFDCCSSLTSIQIPNSVTSIGNYAFSLCSSLTSIEIPNSVTSIGSNAFYYCSSLTSIVIGNSVTSIGDEAFLWCSSLTSIVIGNSVTSIGDWAFIGCSSLTSIEIPNSVTSIGESAFNGCSSLTSIVIGDSVTSIGDWAFLDCSSLTSIQIPNSVTSIGDGAFIGCSSLTSIVVDSGNTKYDSRNGCNAIIETASNTLIAGCQNTIIPNSVTSIGDWAFSYCSGLTSIEIPNSVTSIGYEAFRGCSSLTSIEIPNSVTSIGESAFNGCSSLTSIVIPNSVTSIGDVAFSDCSSLTSIEIPNSVTSIGDVAFSDCSSLTSIEIPNSVTSIGDWAFSDCSSLTSIEIPNSVTSIGDGAFYNCDNLTKITCLATNPPTIELYTFSNYSADLYVPAGCISAYQSANYWEYFNIKEIPIILSTSIALNQTTATLKVTETLTLVATVLPENATNKSVIWKSSNEAVAVVDENGVVTAVGVGEAIITATTTDDSNLSASCKVTVVPTLAESITLDKTEISLEATETATLIAIVLPELATDKSVKWSSSNESIATIDANGLVTAITVGEATITATTADGSDLSASCKVTVTSTLATSITLDYTEYEMVEKSEFQLTATILPESTTNKGVVWSSSDMWIASVDENGLVRAYSFGEAVITATTIDGSNKSATCKIIVAKTLASSISLDKTSATLKETETLTLKATIAPATTTDKSVTWKSSNEAVATVDANGKVTAVAVGEATITATTTDGSNLSASCKVVVQPTLATSITLDYSEYEIVEKSEFQLTATILPESTTNKGVVWSSSDMWIASVDENGLIRAYSVGETVITATTIDGTDLSASCKVTVVSSLAQSITLDKTEVSLEVTETAALVATVLPELATDKSVKWSSSNESVTVVDNNGVVTAISIGEAVITATTVDGSNLSASCKVTVVPTLAESIALDKTEISLEATETATLVATVLPELTTNKSVKWSSSDESVATIDANGLVTAIAVGEATITATTADGSDLSASCKVTVVPTLAVSIELDQTEASVEEKSEFQLTATILPEHTTNKEVAWSSSKKVIATVDETGLVFVKSVGEVIITATTTDGTNLSASCYINVYSSDIDGVEGDDLIVATIGDNIVVKNAQLGSNVRVYAADGSIISSEVATDGDVVVVAPIKGVYIVSVNGKTFKVMVK